MRWVILTAATLVWARPGLAQSPPPSLQTVVADDFSRDTRSDYSHPNGAAWYPGRIVLPAGGTLARKLPSAQWTEVSIRTTRRWPSDVAITLRFANGESVRVDLLTRQNRREVLIRESTDGPDSAFRILRKATWDTAVGAVLIEHRWGLVQVHLGDSGLITPFDRGGPVTGVEIASPRGELSLSAFDVRSLPQAADSATLARARELERRQFAMTAESVADAAALSEEVLQLHRTREVRVDFDLANCLHNTAYLQLMLGRLRRAEELGREAVEIRATLLGEAHPLYTSSVHNLAAVYSAMGDYSRAERMQRRAAEAIAVARGRMHPDYATTLHNLAATLVSATRYAEAEEVVNRVLPIRADRFGERSAPYATSLALLGSIRLHQNDHAAARQLLERSLGLLSGAFGDQHPQTMHVMRTLALAEHFSEELDEAEQRYRRVLAAEAAVRGREHPDYALTLANLAGVYQSRRQFDRAETLLREAMRIVRQHLDETAPIQSERQQKLQQSGSRTYLDNWLSVATITRVSPRDFCETIWQWKGRVTSRQAAFRRVAGNDALAPLFQQLQEVTRRLAAHADRVPAAPPGLGSDASPDDSAVDAWRESFRQLTNKREQLEAAIAVRNDSFRALRQPLTVEGVAAALPKDGVLVDFLEYIRPIGDSGAATEPRFLATISRAGGEPSVVDLGSASVIGAQIDAFRAGFDRSADAVTIDRAKAAAIQLRSTLWIPIEKHFAGATTVLVSPDTKIGMLPFAALPGEAEDTYLLERYRFVSMPLLDGLRRPLRDAEEPSRPEKGLLVVGDVDFDAETSSVPVNAENSELPAWLRRAAPREPDARWQTLPGFQQELAIVRDRFEKQFGDGITVLRGEHATESAFLKQAGRHYNLHIVTHGFFAAKRFRSLNATSADSPSQRQSALVNRFMPGLLSGLVFAGANRAARGDEPLHDGILTAAEIETLNLSRVDLAVLSACETGLGSVSGGEGLTGLQRAFHVAGVRACIATLWEVDDRATQQIMSRFYKYYWEDGHSGVDALRLAQLDVLRNPALTRGVPTRTEKKTIDSPASTKRRSDPLYWGGLVISGDWR